jgi:5-formyltetrahydrofolate cyclo-ligase
MHPAPEDWRAWRKAQRERLVAARLAVEPATLARWREAIDAALTRAFPGLASRCVAFCWPIKNEYDARPLVRTLLARGASAALPVVVGQGQPLEFRAWSPRTRMARGALDIPYPVDSPAVTPEIVLLPMNGWDAQGYRLGYGAGFFDRTFAAMPRRPVIIGVAHELARLDTLHPQPWDMPADYVVTERGVYRRDPTGLLFLGSAEPGGDPRVSSPVCGAPDPDSGRA